MAQLFNSSREKVLIPHLQIADSMWSRMVGLLGTRQLPIEQALWITRGNSVHTFFMKYAIDCIFVDEQLRVKKIYSNLKPWRVTVPVWGARSVIEMSAGQVDRLKIHEGDTLYVGS
jgi:uncharacterized membrane protein (UPF0127 family)